MLCAVYARARICSISKYIRMYNSKVFFAIFFWYTCFLLLFFVFFSLHVFFVITFYEDNEKKRENKIMLSQSIKLIKSITQNLATITVTIVLVWLVLFIFSLSCSLFLSLSLYVCFYPGHFWLRATYFFPRDTIWIMMRGDSVYQNKTTIATTHLHTHICNTHIQKRKEYLCSKAWTWVSEWMRRSYTSKIKVDIDS